tara:strand:- start:531 stop:839 length:309 start_codon:yes stop_codon:yes gene_type:complete
MKLLTKNLKNKLVKNHSEQDGEKEFKAVVKLFNPTGRGTWYLSELDPETNVAFGLAYIHEKELGYIDLTELENFKGLFGLGIERDYSFKANKLSLEDCKQLN